MDTDKSQGKLISHHLPWLSTWLSILDLPQSTLRKKWDYSYKHNLFSSQDELARVLVTLFDSRHLLYQLLWNMFSKEVELADSMQTLFRGNSLASKIMTFCFKVCIHSSIFVQRSFRQYLCIVCREQNVFNVRYWIRHNKFLLMYFFRYMVLPTYKSS